MIPNGYWSKFGLAVLAALVVFAMSTPAPAVTEKTAPAAKEPAANPEMVKVTGMIGKAVRNDSNQDLGRIKDIVLSADGKRVSYAVLSYGMFGEKYFAVPVSALTHSADGKYLILNVDKSQLDKSSGFDKKNWPDTADTSLFGQAPAGTMTGGANVRAAIRAEVRTNRPAAAPEKEPAMLSMDMRRCSSLLGKPIDDSNGHQLGTLNDIRYDRNSTAVAYGIVTYGNILTGGAKYVATPWTAIDWKESQGALHMPFQTAIKGHVNIDRDHFQQLAFDPNHWPDLASREYMRAQAAAFNTEPFYTYAYVGEAAPQPAEVRMDAWAPDSDYNKKFDAKTVTTIDGTIQSVGTFRPASGAAPGLRLRVVQSDGNVVTIHVGPKAFVDKNQFSCSTGDKITVTGSRIALDNRPVILASELKKGDQTLKLRDDQGKPMWKLEDLPGYKELPGEAK